MKKKKIIGSSILVILMMALFASGCAQYYAWTSGYQPDEYYTAKTTDDWTLALYRYRPRGTKVYKIPVLLCHGLGMNATLWDLKKKKSFAQYLCKEGFDVWTVDLRGSGRSSKPGWVALHDLMSGPEIPPTRYEHTSLRFEHADWGIDDHATKDVPTILAEVERVTGSSQVHWVGHSMGGMILFAYLIRTQDPAVKSFVSMACPVNMPRPHSDQLNFFEQSSDLKQLAVLINYRMAGRFFGFLSTFTPTPLDNVLYNRDNMENDVIAGLLQNAVEDMSPGVLDGFIHLIKTGEFISSDKSINYTRSLSSVRVPLLVIGGWADPFCSTTTLYDTYRTVSSQDKTLRVFGRTNGYHADYGHNDFIVGRHAPTDVYPYVARWLKERS